MDDNERERMRIREAAQVAHVTCALDHLHGCANWTPADSWQLAIGQALEELRNAGDEFYPESMRAANAALSAALASGGYRRARPMILLAVGALSRIAAAHDALNDPRVKG